MKRIFTLCIALCTMATVFAQTDTTGRKVDTTKQTPDTIKIGGMVIIREAGAGGGNTVRQGRRSVNIWVFNQRVNLIKHVVNLKYGIGLELNNYFFEDKTIKFNKNPTLIDQSYTGLTKNKLAADYLTMPAMLNFNFTPKKNRKTYGISAGISAGYLYSARQKIKQDGDVDKTRGNFNLRKWKLSYVGEVSLGVVKLYGSYAFKSMFEKGLDLTPYNFGFRLSSW